MAILLDQFLALYGIHHPVSAAVLLVCGAAGGAVAGLAARLAGAGSTVLDLRTGGLTVAGWTGVMAVILLALPFNALIVAVVLALAAAGLAQVAARLGGGAGGMTLSLAWAGGAVVGALLHWAWFMWAYF
ncbi:MAG: hypothetical protein KDE22_13840 [Rhodobacterales bacterium]|nr:hypothetical protein [Rhodobacterales bacterium]